MRAALLVLLAALLLAACGGGDDDSGSASSDACPSDAVVIKMANIKFAPDKTTAGVGKTVCWENDDTVDHNAVANSGADFKSPLFGKGQTFSTTIAKAGTVQYECTVHPGMTGEIDVKG